MDNVSKFMLAMKLLLWLPEITVFGIGEKEKGITFHPKKSSEHLGKKNKLQ